MQCDIITTECAARTSSKDEGILVWFWNNHWAMASYAFMVNNNTIQKDDVYGTNEKEHKKALNTLVAHRTLRLL